jgi:hypothetical protein
MVKFGRLSTTLAAGSIMACFLAAASVSAAPDANGRIHSYVVEIGQTADAKAAGFKAFDLARYVREVPPATISEQSIDEVVGLLESRTDKVREAAATTLAYVGPKARRSEPALRRALKEPDLKMLGGPGGIRYQTNHTSEFAIRDALVQIGAERTMDFSGGSEKKGELTQQR